MKFNPCSNKNILILLGCVFFAILSTSKVSADIDKDLKNITSKLRCMTCQNQTVYSSDAEFSLNIKNIVRKKLKQNSSEKEIIDFLIYRYGEYIVFEPQISKQNIFLWLFPFIFFAISLVFFTIRVKKNT